MCIVTRNDTNRIGGGQFFPAGAVAVITDSPDDAQHAYKVRFNDGAKAMLRRNEFTILKEFKNVPDRGCVADQPQQPGNYQTPAADSPHTAALHHSNFHDWQPFIIYRCVVGSQTFGLSGDGSYVDVEHATSLAQELVAHRQLFLAKLIYQTYNGYVMSQFKKLEQDLRARGEIKWKHAMHLGNCEFRNANVECLNE